MSCSAKVEIINDRLTMAKTEKLSRCKRIHAKNNNLRRASNRAVRYPVNYQLLMAGEGGQGILIQGFSDSA